MISEQSSKALKHLKNFQIILENTKKKYPKILSQKNNPAEEICNTLKK